MSLSLERQKQMDCCICPRCGEALTVVANGIFSGNCSGCHYPWYSKNKVLTWGESKKIDVRRKISLCYQKVINQFHPASSYLLPFRYLSHLYTEKYYQRALNDQLLATKWKNHYLKGLELKAGDPVLDFGCGRGRVTGLCNQLGLKTFGQDISENSWWSYLENSHFQVVPVKCQKLPWKDHSFNALLGFQVLNYLDENQIKNYMHEFFRVLKPGGYCITLEPNSKGFGAALFRKHYGRLYPIEVIEALYHSVGFKTLSQTYEGFYAPIFPTFINLLRHLFSLNKFDMFDFDTCFESMTTPERRALGLMVLQKPPINKRKY